VTQTEQLARLVAENQPCVVLTGAGVSTESGQRYRDSAVYRHGFARSLTCAASLIVIPVPRLVA
jgi:hypothetical protein